MNMCKNVCLLTKVLLIIVSFGKFCIKHMSGLAGLFVLDVAVKLDGTWFESRLVVVHLHDIQCSKQLKCL